MGVFSVNNDSARDLARRVRQGKEADPTLAIYSSYAYHQVGLKKGVRSIRGYLDRFQLFDVEMLAREPFDAPVSTDPDWNTVVPLCPMLSQGWDLLQSKQLQIPDVLQQASRHKKRSLWTTFDPDGMAILIESFNNGDLKL